MRKKIIALIVVLVLALAGGGTVLGITIVNAIEEKEQNEALKKENEKAFITELFHDQGHVYMTPEEPMEGDTVTLRLRSVRYNVTRAQIQYTNDEGVTWNTVNMEFEKRDETGYYDIWKGEIPAEGDLIYYRFTAGNTDLMSAVYYDTMGVNAYEGHYTQGWQIVPGHKVPEWAKGALWYSILPDAFYNANTTNDKQISGENTYATWNNLRKGLADKYGGDLKGIESKLDYIESLNVDAIYMNPIFKSYQNAGYGPVHYDEVESTMGNEEDLASLSEAVHDRDMYLMGDVVLTFALNDSYYFNEDGRWPVVGAAQSEDSKWNEMFEFFNFPDHYLLTWSSPALNLNSQVTKNLFWSNKDSFLQQYAKYYDGYRFDCGGWLWGSTDTDDTEAYTFIKHIREALHEVDEDFYLLSEADWKNLNTGTWDSQWNIDYMPKLQDYAKGLINETLMVEAMQNQEMHIPRNVALCLVNMMCDHDDYRVVQHDDYMYNAAVLIQMTYLGSPSIYYGEEMDFIRENEDGIGTVQSFYAMDWDESNWDQSRLNFYKATGELREEYSCVKTGAVNMLGSDNEQNMLMFGRWDENGAAITVTSQNEEVITVEIPVKRCDIANGTVMTDWYTGAQYVVKDGKITADIIPGGTVLVTGTKSSNYRQTYEVAVIGNASEKNEVITETPLSFIMKGKGTVDKKQDKITLANTVAYEDISVFANLRGDGKGTLMLRNTLNDDSMYYAAVVDKDKLSIVVRTESGKAAKKIAEIDCSKNTYVKLERTADNTFQAYVAEVSDGNLSEWKLIKDSSKKISMNNKIYYGFAPLKGEMRVNNVTYEQLGKESTFDNFDHKVASTLFDNISADFVSLKDGVLTITNSSKEKLHYLLTNAMDNDWTFKAKLDSTPEKDEYAGVVSRQDADNMVVSGKMGTKNGQELFIGKVINGKMAVYASVEAPKEDVIIQLQRIGAYYSAVYSDNDGATWKYIGRVYSNFSNERVGVIVSGEGKASFDWVSFGDSIHDGVSINTPQTPVVVDTSYTNDSTSEECTYEYLTGDWSVVTGGWNQKDKNVFAQASAVNKVFTGLYAEATIEIKDGDGFAGLAFGKEKTDSDASDGFLLKYYDDGNLILTKSNKEIEKCEIKGAKGNAMRIVLEASNGQIIVYAGQEPAPVMVLNNTGYEKGYVSFCTDGVEADFRNFHHGSTNASWNIISGHGIGTGNLISLSDYSSPDRLIHSAATLNGYAFTDFVTKAKLSMTKANVELASASGLLLCASEGKSALADGVYVHTDGEGRLVLSVAGIEKGAYKLPANTSAVEIMCVKQDGVYQIYVKGNPKPVLEYKEEFNRGGVLTLYTINGNASFVNIEVENLQPGQDYMSTKIASNWLKAGKESLKDDFNSTASGDNYYYYNTQGAKFEVKDGELLCTESTEWAAGATVVTDMYSDFTMEFDLRIDSETSGWMSIGMRKSMINGDHNNTGFSFMIGTNGDVFFFSSETLKNSSQGKIRGFQVGEWNKVKIVAEGSNVSAYVNGSKVATFKDNMFYEGFISFTSGMTEYAIDNLKITPMN